MKRLLIPSALALLALLYAADGPKKVDLPPPFHTESATNRPQVVERPGGARLSLPAGFAVDEFASGFERPRIMLAGPSGEIILTDSVDKGSVYVLTDKDGDHKAEGRKKIIDGYYRPFGLAWWKDYLYVAGTSSVTRYKYDKTRMEVGPGQEVVSLKGFEKGHWTRAVLFDAKGEKMYVSVGSGSNVDAGEPKERAAILRFNPDGSGKEIFAEGVRNPVSLRWYPNTTRLYASVQERDGLGDDLVPDYLTEIRRGGFYGWPYAYIGPNEDPRRKGEAPQLVAKTIVPDLPLQAHSAVLDFQFYTGRQFPAKYQGGAFLALHGSWNRSKRVGYSVVFVPFKGGKPAGQPEDFLTGWMLSPDRREVWGRPVGILQLADGSLLISDDGGNRIWRVSYKG